MRKNGCFDRKPLSTRIVVADGWFQDGYTRTPRMVSIPDPMTKQCNYTTTELGRVDPFCTDCKHKEAK